MLASVCSHKTAGSCLHLHPLEGVALSSSSICQDVPCAPVDPVGYAGVTSTVIPSVQVRGEACVKPPSGTVILTTVSRDIPVIVFVCSAESSAIVVVALTVAQSIASITRILACCQAIPARDDMAHLWFRW